MTKRTRTTKNQRGVALVELLLVTVPLCCLSIVLASVIAATGSAKNKSMWMASLKAQRATTRPCGGTPLVETPALSPKYPKFAKGAIKALEIVALEQAFGNMTQTNTKTVPDVQQVPNFYFDKAADQMLPSRTHSARNEATFVCNEPDNGDSRYGKYDKALLGLAEATALELY